jgi:hypothetical protein
MAGRVELQASDETSEFGANEVLVEAEGECEAQTGHDREASGVGEGEVLVRESAEQGERLCLISRRHMNEGAQLLCASIQAIHGEQRGRASIWRAGAGFNR